MYNAMSLSVQGASHLRKNSVCQDSSRFVCAEGYAIAAVSDGHGSQNHFRSDIGSKLAVNVAIESVKDFLQHPSAHEKHLKQLAKNILLKWNNAVREHYNSNPPTGEHNYDPGKIEVIYGATLLAAAATKNYWFAIQIGDGNCVSYYADGRFEHNVPEDNRLIYNMTTSLCDADAIDSFRHYYSEEKPAAIFLTTDGVLNSFDASGGQSYFHKFLEKIMNSLQQYKPHEVEEELRSYLPELSKKGSGDDVSVAVIFDLGSS